MYSRPADPMPFIRPSAAPLLVTHAGPFGPSVTWGMRSRRPVEALTMKRSGGNQHRSMWQSAEIVSYGIARERSSPELGRQAAAEQSQSRLSVAINADVHGAIGSRSRTLPCRAALGGGHTPRS